MSAAYTTFSACYHSRYCAIAEVAALVVVHVVVGRLLFRHSFPALASIPVLVYAGAWLGDALFQHSAPHPASYPTLGLLGDLRLWCERGGAGPGRWTAGKRRAATGNALPTP